MGAFARVLAMFSPRRVPVVPAAEPLFPGLPYMIGDVRLQVEDPTEIRCFAYNTIDEYGYTNYGDQEVGSIVFRPNGNAMFYTYDDTIDGGIREHIEGPLAEVLEYVAGLYPEVNTDD